MGGGEGEFWDGGGSEKSVGWERLFLLSPALLHPNGGEGDRRASLSDKFLPVIDLLRMLHRSQTCPFDFPFFPICGNLRHLRIKLRGGKSAVTFRRGLGIWVS